MTAKLSGPAGGEWVHVVATGRDVPTRCDECGDLTHDSWQWYVGLVSHARLCAACVNELTAAVVVSVTPKEAPVPASTQGVTPDHLAEIALALEAAHLDWEQGRATSPDTNDYVLITERILTERLGPEYLYLAEATRESVAQELWERQCGGDINEWAEMAEWLATAVTVGPDLGVCPMCGHERERHGDRIVCVDCDDDEGVA